MGKLDDDPAKTKNEPLIIKTLLQAKNNGKAKKTLQCFASHLKYINQHANINDPESVKTYIADLNRDPQTKNSYAIAYNWYCKTNKIQWKKPYFKWERKMPMIPTTVNIDKIISAASRKYATIFTILAETGLKARAR